MLQPVVDTADATNGYQSIPSTKTLKQQKAKHRSSAEQQSAMATTTLQHFHLWMKTNHQTIYQEQSNDNTRLHNKYNWVDTNMSYGETTKLARVIPARLIKTRIITRRHHTISKGGDTKWHKLYNYQKNNIISPEENA